MPRPRRTLPARRYHLTLDQPVAEELAAYAAATHRPISTAAATLIADALSDRRAADGKHVREARRQVEEVAARVQALHRQVTAGPGNHKPTDPPRWEWPMETLLADTPWWDRWLPRLSELMGRRSATVPLGPPQEAHDARGYIDVLELLFPPVVSDGTRCTWRSAAYPDAAGRDGDRGRRAVHSAARADVWEPVIRHVVEALCLLERTGQPGADPYLRLRAEAEISGPWARILLYLVGQEAPAVPRERLT